MNRTFFALGGAAVIVVIAALALGIYVNNPRSGVGAPPSPSPTTEPPSRTTEPLPNPTSAATPSAAATQGASELSDGSVQPGEYFGDVEGYRYTFTVPGTGWIAMSNGDCCVFYKGGDSDGAIVFFEGDVTSLYRDACSPGTAFEPGPTVDDLVNALASLEDFEFTAPYDVTVSGYEGKRVAVTVPMDVDVRSTDCNGGKYSLSAGRWFQAPGQTDVMSILDLDGQRQVIVFSHAPAVPAGPLHEMDSIWDSLVIEPI